jgi:shikimate kinase
MGSGKSYWGKKWAAINHMSFVDLDELIEKKSGKSIADIFETLGEEHFRKLEAETLRSCAQMEDTIVACGGGTPCFYENMHWMNDHGITIHLSATPTEILQRVLGRTGKTASLKALSPEESSFIYRKETSRKRAILPAGKAETTIQPCKRKHFDRNHLNHHTLKYLCIPFF